MSIINYTATNFVATPPPLTTHYYQPLVPQYHQQREQGPYQYPRPTNPFIREEINNIPQNNHNNNLNNRKPYQTTLHNQQTVHPPSSNHHQNDPRVQNRVPNDPNDQGHPLRPIQYERVTPVTTRTSLHPIIDYDGDYYDDVLVDHHATPAVTPIQGPIFLKNGSVPVVPLYSYPVINNGTFVQIPILWTALSVALGYELRADYIRGVPCIKKYQQLFCPTAGSAYPIDRIELFIDENKALMKRMYGEFNMAPEYGPRPPGNRGKRSTKPGVPDLHADPGPDPLFDKGGGESVFGNLRTPRQSFRNNQSETGRIDACESKVEIVTPYWASNSAGKIRAIVNTQHFEQAIHQEVCAKGRTNRCSGDCGCEQKYKWHRLLAYDPDNDCKGIFMDWFLFPSCCVCRCNPT